MLGLMLNGRGANFDSGGPVYNELGHVVGINDSATVTVADVGITIYMRLDSVKPWLEATMAAAAQNHLPQLALQKTPAGCSVSWGPDATGWTLQKSDQLSGWSNVGATISTSGSYTHSGIETSRFFRLVKP